MPELSKVQKWTPQKNEVVAVSYDGKVGRTTKGLITKVRGFCITVQFIPWATEEEQEIENIFIRSSNISYGGYVKTQDSLMNKMFGLPGDYYSVRPWDLVESWRR